MKLSIFENSKALPLNKSEKVENARYFSRPYLPKVVEITTEEDLINIITNHAWSPFVFRNARLQDEFVSTDFLVLDIDSGLTIEESEIRVKEAGVACLCLSTSSHKPDAHKFRLIFPISRTITSEEDFLASMEDLAQSFPEADKACITDTARAYFGSTMVDGYWLEGELLEPIKAVIQPTKQVGKRPSSESKVRVTEDLEELIVELYGEAREKIPEAVDYFIRNAASGLEGNWHVSLNAFTFVLSLQSVDFDVVYDIVEFLAPEILDKRDIDCINRAYSDGLKLRDE